MFAMIVIFHKMLLFLVIKKKCIINSYKLVDIFKFFEVLGCIIDIILQVILAV